MSQPLPAVQRHNTLRKRWAVPRMADNCTLPINSGAPSLSYQVLALFDILQRAPITIKPITIIVIIIIIIIITRSVPDCIKGKSELQQLYST